MFKNTVAASVLLFAAMLSVALSAKAVPPDPKPQTPPLAMSR
ncbi:MAG TPA: hypothetical protein VHU83_24855 [Bryobacteraceae bacterium]|jgi:hypothetical protein|nr:hypothetical protein [Bryobacteraceae bacterium]